MTTLPLPENFALETTPTPTTLPHIKTHYIFDLDGTLIESLPGIARALNTALAENNHSQHSTLAIRTFIGDGSHTLCQRAAPLATAKTIDDLHRSFLHHYKTSWQNGTHIYPGIPELLKSLGTTGHTLSILSNKPHQFTTEIVNKLFPKNTFALTLGQRKGIAKKPDPSGIHEILETLNQTPQNTALIGDSTIDISTAKNANIASIAVTYGYHNHDQLAAESPTRIAHTVQQLTNFLTTPTSP